MTKTSPGKYKRRSIRLKGYDYSLPGAYFVTLVAKGRDCIFGEIINDKVVLNEIGLLVEEYWLKMPNRFENIKLDECVLMPNHLHGIIILEEAEGKGEATRELVSESDHDLVRVASPLQPAGTQPGSLNALVQNFKLISTRMVNQRFFGPGKKIWQRNYYERIIRNEEEFNAIRQYICDNPMNWELDQENPSQK